MRYINLSIPAFMVAGTGSDDAGNVEENRLELAEGENRDRPSGGYENVLMSCPIQSPKYWQIERRDHGDIPSVPMIYDCRFIGYKAMKQRARPSLERM
ncbi:MAG: hypothetical protein ACLVJ6_04215 [Merdibacter sp.]